MKNLKKYKISILIAAIIVIVGSCIPMIILNNDKLKIYKNDNFSLKYDKSWKVVKSDNNFVKLKNHHKANLNINITKLESDEYLDELLDSLIYKLNSQNKNYNLISKEKTKLTNRYYNGYKLLYENKSSSVLLSIIKDDNNLIVFSYEATNRYFDILLDSAQNIIYNFNLNYNEYDFTNIKKKNVKEIKFDKNSQLVKKMNSVKKYEIADNNYLVNYSIPDIFKLTSWNSKLGLFSYSNRNENINVTTKIINTNIYDYIDESSRVNISSDFNNLDSDNSINDLNKMFGSIIIDNYSGYSYKVNYSKDKVNHENIIICIPLNRNHIFVFNIRSNNVNIPQEVIDSIKINKVKNYSSYITNKPELRRFTDNTFDTFDIVDIKLTNDYKELDKSNNMYDERYFVKEYDEETKIASYEIEYLLTSTDASLDSQLDLINSKNKIYDNVSEILYEKDIELNGKSFKLYSASYVNNTNQCKVNENILVYELLNQGYLVIIVDGNNKEIGIDLLNEISNFDIENKNI